MLIFVMDSGGNLFRVLPIIENTKSPDHRQMILSLAFLMLWSRLSLSYPSTSDFLLYYSFLINLDIIMVFDLVCQLGHVG